MMKGLASTSCGLKPWMTDNRFEATSNKSGSSAGAVRCSVLRPQLAYVLSKNFVIWDSKTIAAQFGGKGARVVSVSPGSFDTAMGKLEEGAGAMARLAPLHVWVARPRLLTCWLFARAKSLDISPVPTSPATGVSWPR